MLLDGGVEPLDEEDELNKLAQDLVAGAAATVVAVGGGAYGVDTMIELGWNGCCGGGTVRSGGGPGGGRGVFIGMSR